MFNKLVTTILSFVLGIVLGATVLSFKDAEVVQTYDERQILSQMISVFDALPADGYPSFTISYYPKRRLESKPDFRVNLDYGLIEYKEEFDNFDDFISFISDQKKYKDNILGVSD